MEQVLYLFAMLHNAHDLGLMLGVLVGAWIASLLIFWVFYSGCSLGAGLSMRVGCTFGVVLMLICTCFVFRDLKEYFIWWHYTPGPTPAVMADAILLWGLSIVWLVLIWAIWPRPRRIEAAL